MNRWFTAAAFFLAATFGAYGVASTYARSIANVLISEGGSQYTNHPRDPGGPTKYGITIYDVRLYVKRNATARDVRKLTEAQAHEIYRKRYAEVLHFDELPAGLDYTILDYGVNSGVGRAARVLRRVLDLPAGTVISDAVLVEVNRRDAGELIEAVNAERLRFLKSLRTWKTFGRGWGRRVAGVLRVSMQMHEHPFGLLKGKEFQQQPGGAAKAYSDDDDATP